MDLPSFKDLNNQVPVDIETPDGVIQLLPDRVQRGSGNQKWYLAIKGIVQARVGVLGQCHVRFKGRQLDGHFTKAFEVNGRWAVTFETVIPLPEYWGEPSRSC